MMIEQFEAEVNKSLENMVNNADYHGDVKKDLLVILNKISYKIINEDRKSKPELVELYQKIVKFEEENAENLESKMLSHKIEEILNIFSINSGEDLLTHYHKSKDFQEEAKVICGNLEIIFAYLNFKTSILLGQKRFSENLKMKEEILRKLSSNEQIMIKKITNSFGSEPFFPEVESYLNKNKSQYIWSGSENVKEIKEEPVLIIPESEKRLEKSENIIKEKPKMPIFIQTKKENEPIDSVVFENDMIEKTETETVLQTNSSVNDVTEEILQPKPLDMDEQIVKNEPVVAENSAIGNDQPDNHEKNEKLDKILAKLRNKAKK